MRKTFREAADPRVIRRHRISRPNAMASVASDEAFLLIECIKKCVVQGRASEKLQTNLTVFAGREFILSSMRRCLTGRDFTRKKVRH